MLLNLVEHSKIEPTIAVSAWRTNTEMYERNQTFDNLKVTTACRKLNQSLYFDNV